MALCHDTWACSEILLKETLLAMALYRTTFAISCFISISFLQILPDLGRLFHFFFTYAFFLQQENAFVLRPGWLQLILLSFWAASINRHVTSSTAVVTVVGTFTVENDQNYDGGNYHDNTTRNSNNYWKTGWRPGRFSLISIWVRQK